MSRKVRLVTRADDAGGCRSANQAIAGAVQAGAVKNVSVMACGVEVEAAARLFAGRDDICVGLHVTLNAEWDTVKWGPVLPPEQVPSLVEPTTGHFTPTPAALQERGFVLEQAVAEVEAQLRRARELGLEIVYLDEHMGVGWIKSEGRRLGEALEELCQREGLLYVDALRFERLPAPEAGAPPVTDPESLARRWLGSLQQAPPGDYLLITHPGRVAPDMEAFYHSHTGQKPGEVAAERDRERQALSGPLFVSGCQQLGIELTRYDQAGVGR